MHKSDIVIIGAGIVGLATAYNVLERFPDKSVTILEKERELAQHQSGHNSGVLHSGIYYKPGSLKAINCRAGKKAMEAFCEREGIPYRICGKVIVALDEADVDRLNTLYERGRANGVACEIIEPARLRELEPDAAGIKAIHVPEAGIVDYRQVCRRLAAIVAARGHRITMGAEVTALCENGGGVIVKSTAGEFSADYLVNCAGLHSDRVTALGPTKPPAKIVPFRGEYYRLKPQAASLCNALIYPVPDPAFPFLGVHFTRMISDEVECGPNAVLALAREGYRKTNLDLADLVETLAYPGFRSLAARYWRMGLGEMWRSVSKRAFVKALQRLIPVITPDDLEPAPTGVRAQAVAPDGSMLDDFTFAESKRIVNVINAPSPAATASLSIGRTVVDRLAIRFG